MLADNKDTERGASFKLTVCRVVAVRWLIVVLQVDVASIIAKAEAEKQDTLKKLEETRKSLEEAKSKPMVEIKFDVGKALQAIVASASVTGKQIFVVWFAPFICAFAAPGLDTHLRKIEQQHDTILQEAKKAAENAAIAAEFVFVLHFDSLRAHYSESALTRAATSPSTSDLLLLPATSHSLSSTASAGPPPAPSVSAAAPSSTLSPASAAKLCFCRSPASFACSICQAIFCDACDRFEHEPADKAQHRRRRL